MKPIIPPEFICRKCKVLKSSSEFYSGRTICKECHKLDPFQKRDANMRRRYGIGVQQYNEMFEKQHGLCAICQKEETQFDYRVNAPAKLRVDHDHTTGRVRGLLCSACNTALGMINEDIGRLRALEEYLLQHKQGA